MKLLHFIYNLSEKKPCKECPVSIWWYKDGEFWDFSKTTDDAVECQGYLQYSNTKNHLNLWSQAVTTFVDDLSEREKIRNAGYKSLERGRVIFNIRTQCYEIICSTELANDPEFRKTCIDYFNLRGNRYDSFRYIITAYKTHRKSSTR